MRIENIKKPKGSKGNSKRKGRGIGSGRGKTSGRGHKGAGQRSGGGTYNPGFEGGQMPLVRRIPKRGFTNKWRREWSVVNVGTLQKTEAIKDGGIVDLDLLVSTKVIKKKRLPFKILGKGTLSKAITVKANAFSESAIKAISEAGGKAEVVSFKVSAAQEAKKKD
ncbi:MAG: 50S ribosomal protein L15 [Candidatus Tantalella remota]|nr:50S ribosomal protein L15 [Candidatus Tantalella remota]